MVDELPDDAVTVSIVLRDARGFTYHYADFATSAGAAAHALRILGDA